MKKIFPLFLLLLLPLLWGEELYEKLDRQIEKKNSFLCVGLDPDLDKMPIDLQEEEGVFPFLKEVVDQTEAHACAYKIQKAFFDRLNSGHKELIRICHYIERKYPHMPIFIDCKIGDIDNTMEMYMHFLFDQCHADAVIINPYMGDDVFTPFEQDPEKGAIVLVQTSNPTAKVIQELKLENGNPLWKEVLALTTSRWNKNQNMIPVLSSHADEASYIQIRKEIPNEMPILLAGIGSQGGNPAVLRHLLNREGRGVFVNSSRGILYTYDPQDNTWQKQIQNAAINLKNKLNAIAKESIKGKFVLLLGPSGVGKSTLIEQLKKIDDRFIYISPYTTRELREGEKDKIHISQDELHSLEQDGKLLKINKIYGIYYATPKEPIDKALQEGKFPILDWPVSELDVMKKAYSDQIYAVYVSVPSITELKWRLSQDQRDKDGKRLAAGIEEHSRYCSGEFGEDINFHVVNKRESHTESAAIIYENFINALFSNEKNQVVGDKQDALPSHK